MSPPRIAIDAMGGDDGVRTMLAGVALARARGVSCRFLLVGQADRIEEALTRPEDPSTEFGRLRAERDQARRIAIELEQQNARALELLEREDTGGWFSPEALKDAVDEAKAVLRGGGLEAGGVPG